MTTNFFLKYLFFGLVSVCRNNLKLRNLLIDNKFFKTWQSYNIWEQQ